jgi:uncharacterized protein (TIGR02118 family)
MVNVLTLFGMPVDGAAFDEYFATKHRPLLLQVPNVDQLVINRIAGAASGESPFFLIVELRFPSEKAMQEGLNSEAGQAMARDYGNFASGGVTVLFSQATTQALDIGTTVPHKPRQPNGPAG